jgi:predicted O-methyltransferase YrrM
MTLQFLDPAISLPPGFQDLGHRFPAQDAFLLLTVAARARVMKPPVYPPTFEVAEIGSFVGLTTLLLAIYGGATRIYAIDTWEGSPNDNAIDAAANVNETYQRLGRDEVLGTFLHNTKAHRPPIAFSIMPSIEAAERLDGVFDLVFLDGDHSYEGCRDDIFAWWPKVRPGGILCGHDYGSFNGVTRAVNLHVPHAVTQLPASIWWRQKESQS